MFEKLRRPSKANKQGQIKKLFSYIVFGAICIIFVFLTPMSSQFFGEGVVAYVGSEPIRSREFRLIEGNIKRQYQKRLNEASPEESERLQKQIRQNALQQLVNVYLISHSAKNAGFMVSNQALQDEIKSYPIFQRKGRFVYSNYISFLKNQKLNSVRFEDRIRKIKMSENWRELFNKSISSNDLEKNKNQEKNQYKIRLQFAELSLAEIEKLDEIQKFVSEKNLSKVNQFLNKKKISWKKIDEISLFDSVTFPILNDSSVMKIFLNHLPRRGLIPELMLLRNQAYIVNILSFRKTKRIKQKNAYASFLNYEKSIRLFEKWMHVQKEKIPIRQNIDL